MQIATLNYQYDPKENLNGDSRAKLRHQQVLTAATNLSTQKNKHRRSIKSNISGNKNLPLPPIAINGGIGKRPSSIRVTGNSLASSKLTEASAHSFQHQIPRSRSRQSEASDISRARSRSVSPGETGGRTSSKLVRLRFGYPVTLRSADFYGPQKSKEELQIREESFVNDSIRSAHQSRRSSIIPAYEPMDDPHLRRFFQSPIVLDLVRKTLQLEYSPVKTERTRPKNSTIKKRSKLSPLNDTIDRGQDDYLRIVTKGSSGYSKLNGYDCIPPNAPARRRLSTSTDPHVSNSHQWHSGESQRHRSTTRDKFRVSADYSLTSFPTHSSVRQQQQQQRYKKKKVRRPSISRTMQPIATSSPLRRLVEATMPNVTSQSAAKTEDVPEDQTTEVSVIPSNLSQD